MDIRKVWKRHIRNDGNVYVEKKSNERVLEDIDNKNTYRFNYEKENKNDWTHN